MFFFFCFFFLFFFTDFTCFTLLVCGLEGEKCLSEVQGSEGNLVTPCYLQDLLYTQTAEAPSWWFHV